MPYRACGTRTDIILGDLQFSKGNISVDPILRTFSNNVIPEGDVWLHNLFQYKLMTKKYAFSYLPEILRHCPYTDYKPYYKS